eukprot:s3762_g4.t1
MDTQFCTCNIVGTEAPPVICQCQDMLLSDGFSVFSVSLPENSEVVTPLPFDFLSQGQCLAARCAPRSPTQAFAERKFPQTSVLKQPSRQGLGSTVTDVVRVEAESHQTAVALKAICQGISPLPLG